MLCTTEQAILIVAEIREAKLIHLNYGTVLPNLIFTRSFIFL